MDEEMLDDLDEDLDVEEKETQKKDITDNNQSPS
jgi:hypothetical protein